MSDNSAVATVAAQWRALLSQKEHTDGSPYWCRNDDARDDALQAAIREAHGDKLPNDHSYQYVVNALNAIEEYAGDTDTARGELTADDYNSDLLAWLASYSERVSFCDDYLSEYGSDGGIMGIIRGGQLKERVEVFEIITHHIRDAAGKLPQVWTRENTELHTWFERNRSHVELRAVESGETLIEWWDNAVKWAVEDGFLNPKDFHGSALDYLAQMGGAK